MADTSKPDWDQHFLQDAGILDRIISSAALRPQDKVLEVGAGRGALTRRIAATCPVIALEIDKTLDPRGTAATAHNIQVVYGDALRLIPRYAQETTVLMGNIPYGIAEPLLRLLFRLEFREIALTTGERFFRRISDPATRLGTFCQSFYSIEASFTIPRKAFSPPPATGSVCFVLVPKQDPSRMDRILQRLARQSDKQLGNGLREALCAEGLSRREARVLVEHHIPAHLAGKRPFALGEPGFQNFTVALRRLVEQWD